MSDNQLYNEVMAALATVEEPELHRDLVTLKMVQDLSIEGDVASFTVMLTTPACPLKDVIYDRAKAAVVQVEGINDIKIKWGSNVPTDGRVFGQIQTPIKSVVAVSSGKGGVGKSTVSVNLAVALARSGAKVGLMDADILGPNIPKMVGLRFAPPQINAEKKLIPFEVFGLKVMSMGFLADPNQPMIWRGPMLHSAIRQFFTDVEWGELDYMIVDLPPGTGDAQLSLAQSVPLTGAIVVTQPQSVAVDDARRGLAMFEKLEVPVLGVIENMTGDLFGEGGGQDFAQERGVNFLGSIPLMANVRVGGDSGHPVVVDDPDSPAGKAFQAVAEQVAAAISVQLLKDAGNVIPLNVIE